ncbi:MAG TPA: PrsW family intramembrane metalloprotease [Kribbellaceae bacterium]
MSYPPVAPGPAGSAYSPGGPYPQVAAMGSHPVPGQRRNRGVLLGVLIAVVMAVSGLAIFGIVYKQTGSAGFVWGLIFAFVPMVVIAGLYLWLDRYEPEPAKTVVFAFCWGAFVATLAALFINTGAAQLMGEVRGGGSRAAVFVAPPVEEFLKGSVVLLIALVRRREFDGIIDGLVYAGMAGIGFAFTENILYYGRVFRAAAEQGGRDSGLQTTWALFVIRGVFSPFAHPLFTSFTAIGIGIAVRHRSTVVRFLAPLIGYLAAVLAHALWNGAASYAGVSGFIGVYLMLMVPVFLGMVIFAIVMRSRESQLIASRLYDYIRFGWMVHEDVPLVATLRGRRTLRNFASRYGPEAEDAAKDFQRTATELAYLRDKVVRQVIGQEALQEERQLLEELRNRRSVVPFPPAPTPYGHYGPGFGTPQGPTGYGPPGTGYGPYPPPR